MLCIYTNLLLNLPTYFFAVPKRQKQNSKKNHKKTKSECVGKSHDCFPVSNTANKMGFSYSVMEVGVQYKLISGMAISPDHSIGETTMFPEAFNQTLRCNPNMINVLGDGIYGCRWITDLKDFMTNRNGCSLPSTSSSNIVKLCVEMCVFFS